MKKIVRGNDFTLRIPVCKIVNGEQVAFPLPACTDIVVNIVNQYRRVALSYAIDTAEDNIILARVEGDAVSVGTYALEVRGKIFGNDWRSKEYEQFAIVDNNAVAWREQDGGALRHGDTAALGAGDVRPGVLQRDSCTQEGGERADDHRGGREVRHHGRLPCAA